MTRVDFAKVRNFTVVYGDYAVFLFDTDDDGVEPTLVGTIERSLEVNTNYILLVEPDTSAYGGYRLKLAE